MFLFNKKVGDKRGEFKQNTCCNIHLFCLNWSGVGSPVGRRNKYKNRFIFLLNESDISFSLFGSRNEILSHWGVGAPYGKYSFYLFDTSEAYFSSTKILFF